MAYRNGTYTIFHAGGTTDPTASDMKSYRMLQAWAANDAHEFRWVNSHEKSAAVRDTSKNETLRRALVQRLNKSKNVLAIITERTKDNKDWVPFEFSHAIYKCKIPIIATYPGQDRAIRNPGELSRLWPPTLKLAIEKEKASVIHIPFRQRPVFAAVRQFGPDALPRGGGYGRYSDDAYRDWKIA